MNRPINRNKTSNSHNPYLLVPLEVARQESVRVLAESGLRPNQQTALRNSCRRTTFHGSGVGGSEGVAGHDEGRSEEFHLCGWREMFGRERGREKEGGGKSEGEGERRRGEGGRE